MPFACHRCTALWSAPSRSPNRRQVNRCRSLIGCTKQRAPTMRRSTYLSSGIREIQDNASSMRVMLAARQDEAFFRSSRTLPPRLERCQGTRTGAWSCIRVMVERAARCRPPPGGALQMLNRREFPVSVGFCDGPARNDRGIQRPSMRTTVMCRQETQPCSTFRSCDVVVPVSSC
jgi:hypothetical protein